MDRRAVILAGAATAVAAPVFAQTNKSPSSKGTDQPSAPQTNSSPAALSQPPKLTRKGPRRSGMPLSKWQTSQSKRHAAQR